MADAVSSGTSLFRRKVAALGGSHGIECAKRLLIVAVCHARISKIFG
jgi:hypothetical protein